MSGGIAQLVAVGAQDAHLVGSRPKLVSFAQLINGIPTSVRRSNVR